MKVEINDKDLTLLDNALHRAIDDTEEYLRHGNVEGDYQDPAELAAVKALPEDFRQLRRRIQDLLVHKSGVPEFTVILIYPDYIATNYGDEYFIGAVEAEDAETAIPLVQEQAKMANSQECEYRADFAMVAVFEGGCAAVMTRNFS